MLIKRYKNINLIPQEGNLDQHIHTIHGGKNIVNFLKLVI